MNKIDFINKEYEARVMVSEKEYLELLRHYSKCRCPKRKIINTNTYFDYENLFLTKNHMVLRTRSISESEYELTLKIKGEDSDLELNHILSKEEYQMMREKILIPQSNVLDKLKELKIDLSKLVLLTDLTTERMEIKYKKYTLVIDKNYFRNRVDYNVEVESFTRKAAKIYLLKHVLPFGITYKKGYVSKSRRAIYNL